MLYYYEIVREVTVIRNNAMLNSVMKCYWDILQLNWNICSRVKYRPEYHCMMHCRAAFISTPTCGHISLLSTNYFTLGQAWTFTHRKTSSFWPLTPNIRIEHIILFSLCSNFIFPESKYLQVVPSLFAAYKTTAIEKMP